MDSHHRSLARRADASRLEDAISEVPLVAIVRLGSATHVLDAVRLLVAAGVRAVEITLTTPEALKAVRVLIAEGLDVCVGVGSVRAPDDLERASEAGAQFVVTPTVDPVVVAAARADDVPIICGALTPTELARAHDAGADLIKLFPAGAVGGPQYVRDVLAPLPYLRLIPTGGVNEHNMADYVAAGATAVAVGSALIDDATFSPNGPAQLTERVRKMLAPWRG